MTNVPINRAYAGGRLAQIERMIEQYRHAKKRRLQQRAIALWRKLEARQALVRFEKPLERVH
jgi:cobalamin biosynthesis Mg chelatase CobN